VKWITTVALENESPENPNEYIWVTRESNSGQSTVPLVTFDDHGKERVIGSIPVGTRITPMYIRTYSRRHYYGIKEEDVNSTGNSAGIRWIPGNFLKLAGFADGK
jgi:hypothetical protein